MQHVGIELQIGMNDADIIVPVRYLGYLIDLGITIFGTLQFAYISSPSSQMSVL